MYTPCRFSPLTVTVTYTHDNFHIPRQPYARQLPHEAQSFSTHTRYYFRVLGHKETTLPSRDLSRYQPGGLSTPQSRDWRVGVPGIWHHPERNHVGGVDEEGVWAGDDGEGAERVGVIKTPG